MCMHAHTHAHAQFANEAYVQLRKKSPSGHDDYLSDISVAFGLRRAGRLKCFGNSGHSVPRQVQNAGGEVLKTVDT